MRLVLVESPLAGDVLKNVAYAKACMRDCLLRGEAPFASHLLYAQDDILDDLIAEEREIGMEAGFAWGEQADVTVVYTDLGISPGMERGIAAAKKAGRPIEHRTIGISDFSGREFSTTRVLLHTRNELELLYKALTSTERPPLDETMSEEDRRIIHAAPESFRNTIEFIERLIKAG